MEGWIDIILDHFTCHPLCIYVSLSFFLEDYMTRGGKNNWSVLESLKGDT